jgi:5-formyltetrahydrofolate cyclo-ligase
MFYCTHGSEVPTDEMIEQALAQGKNVAVPLVAPDHWEIVAARITSLRDDVRPGTYGIREPDLQRCRLFRPEEIDLVLVPGIVFDGHGHRLGYGKGFYDRWLGHFPVKQRIGIAFDFQVVKKLPTGINDLPVSLIITEKRTIKTKRSKERCVTIAPNVMKHFERSKR